MKALLYDKKHTPTKFRLAEVEQPTPKADQVLIQVHTAALNAADYRSMQLGIVPRHKILGSGVAGTVASAGGPAGLQEGDAVIADVADSGFGGLAEYAVANHRAVTPKPAGLSFAAAATLPVAATTALLALRDRGQLQAGQSVLIVGSGGGVGSFAVQLAHHYGATITAVCSGNNAAQARALGAHQVIDYTQEGFAQRSERYDLVLAVNGSYPLRSYRQVLKPQGRLVVVGGSLSQVFKAMFLGKLLFIGSKSLKILFAKGAARDLKVVAELMAEGHLQGNIAHQYPLAEAAAGMEYLSQGHATGKVVIGVMSASREPE